MKSKCSKSPDGKHKWAHKIETQIISGTRIQVRKCEKCGYKQEQVKDILGHEQWQ